MTTASGRLDRGSDPQFDASLRVLALGIIAVFAIFVVRLSQLQIIEGDELRMLSARNSVRSIRLPAPRGDILDRHGRIIATTRPAFGVRVIPNDIQRPETTYAVLGRLLDADPNELRDRVGAPRGRSRYQPVSLRSDLNFESLARIESHRFTLPGVETVVRARRAYPAGDAAAHLLGTLGEVRADQLQTRAFASYEAGDLIGQAGVEALFESHLHGRPGGRNVMVDVAGREVEVLDEVAAVAGGSLVLAIDRDLQRAAAAAFRKPEGGVQPGALVAMDPRNGDILALVSSPAFDPNAFAAGIDSASWAALRDDPWKPMQNRALGGQYPPGSTYKAIVAAAALEEGVIGAETPNFCPGHFTLGRRTYRCWKRQGHGTITLVEAIQKSCDVFFYQAGLKLGIDRLAYFARGFNLGRRTGIELPGEQSGLIPNEAWKEKRFGEPWILGETVSASIGQGFDLVTPLQLAVAYAAIANGGTLVQPRLTLRLVDENGAVSEEMPPVTRGKVPVRPEYLAQVRRGLEAVVEEPGGTGGRARVRGVRVAGKTGTSQVVALKHTEDLDEEEVQLRHRDHAWFVAYAPAEQPEILVSVLVEHGGHGGSAAAPIAGQVLTRYFEERESESESEPAVAFHDASSATEAADAGD